MGVCCCLLLLAMNAMNRCNFVTKFTSSRCCLPVFAYVSLCSGLSPKSTPDGPQIDHLGTLKPLQNHEKSIKIRSGIFLGHPPCQLSFNLEARGQFLVNFGSALRPSKQPKITPWPKK